MTTLRKPPPPVEPRPPLCGVCGNEVQTDPGGWECLNCEARWPFGDEGAVLGEWEHPDAPQCVSIDGRFLPGGVWAREHPNSELYRCLLHTGHPFDHEFSSVGAHRAWSDEGAATEAQLSQNAVEVQT